MKDFKISLSDKSKAYERDADKLICSMDNDSYEKLSAIDKGAVIAQLSSMGVRAGILRDRIEILK